MRETVRQVLAMPVKRSITRFSIIDNQFRRLVHQKIRHQVQVIFFTSNKSDPFKNRSLFLLEPLD